MPEKTPSTSLSSLSLVALWGIVISLVARDYSGTILSLSGFHLLHTNNDSPNADLDIPLSFPPKRSELMQTRILSYDPFIVHIEDFLSTTEREHLMQLAHPLLARSTVLHSNGTQEASEARTSSTAYLPTDDFIVSNIRRRAAEFQGYLPSHTIDLQVTSYQAGQQYRAHYDWFTNEEERTTNRLSTFFAILDADCENCGTQFPNINNITWENKDSRWCRLVDCSQEILTSRNLNGSAIFWRNLDEHGKGRKDVLHAGLPALGGRKVGLNIWTEVRVAPYVQP